MDTPDFGIIASLFIVRRLFGDNEISLLMSFRDSTVSGLEFFSSAAMILLALRIWLFQTPPICQAPGGFLYHIIQSVPFCRR